MSRGAPKLAPREPLTKKAEAAIRQYVRVKGSHLPYLSYVVTFVLEAERMERSRLYGWLEEKGFEWDDSAGEWKVK